MIGTENKYVFRFSLGEDQDFIDEPDLGKFTMIEESGNILPTFHLTFMTRNEKIVPRLNEGFPLEVSYGKDSQNLIDVSLAPTRVQSFRKGEGRRQVGVTGLMSANPYVMESDIFISQEKSALEVMRDQIQGIFTPDFNRQRSNDSQIWIRHNQTKKKFVNQLWTHADLGNSFPAVAISADGRFIMRDVIQALNEDFKWRFVPDPDNNNPQDIYYNANYDTDNMSGFINGWFGYGREKSVFDMEEGSHSFQASEVEPILATTGKLAKRADIEKRFSNTGAVSQNTHPNYWQSALHNISNLVTMGAVKLVLTTENIFFNIRPLDLVMFRDTTVDRENVGEGNSSEFNSGLYLTGKVVRTVENRQFLTTVEIMRESFNNVQTQV